MCVNEWSVKAEFRDCELISWCLFVFVLFFSLLGGVFVCCCFGFCGGFLWVFVFCLCLLFVCFLLFVVVFVWVFFGGLGGCCFVVIIYCFVGVFWLGFCWFLACVKECCYKVSPF